MGLDYHLV